MMLSGTKTEKNLQTAFAGESEARNKYTFFATIARKEGYEQIAENFEQTARQEMAHAKKLAELLGLIGDTKENLKVSADGEREEWTTMYKQFERDARSEGFDDIAELFAKLATAEGMHERHYRAYLAEFTGKPEQNGGSKIMKNTKEQRMFECLICNQVLGFAPGAPAICPACGALMEEQDSKNRKEKSSSDFDKEMFKCEACSSITTLTSGQATMCPSCGAAMMKYQAEKEIAASKNDQ